MTIRQKSGLLLALILLGTLFLSYYLLGIYRLWDKTRKGLDIQGGIRVVYEGVDTPEMPVTDKAMDQARSIMENRINRLGVVEPVIQRQGERRIVVELPGIKDPEKAIETIGRTALLEFKDADGNIIFTGKDLDPRGIDVEIQGDNQPVVTLQLKGEAVKRFAEATRKAVQFSEEDPKRRIGIYLDGELVQNPSVREPIESGRAVITGYESVEEARRVVIALQSGALPVKLRIIENRTISPTLGADALKKSEVAALIGIAAVAAFMVLYYRVPGFWASFSLLIYIVLVLLLLFSLRATLTLPGIAGFVLSVGMAVDVNVLIFERVREELQLGRTPWSALEVGHKHAFRAILDSHATTLIGAAIIFFLGTGPVRGFAVTLSLGTLVNLFTALLVTRYVLQLMLRAGARPGPLFFGSPRPSPSPAGGERMPS